MESKARMGTFVFVVDKESQRLQWPGIPGIKKCNVYSGRIEQSLVLKSHSLVAVGVPTGLSFDVNDVLGFGCARNFGQEAKPQTY